MELLRRASQLSGAVASGGAIIKSANADSVVPGEPTWTLQTTVAGGMLAVAAVDATTAYATTASRLLLKTIDGGTTWVTLANAPSMIVAQHQRRPQCWRRLCLFDRY